MRKLARSLVRFAVLGASWVVMAPGIAKAQRPELVVKPAGVQPKAGAATTVSIGVSRDVTIDGGGVRRPLNGVSGATSGRVVSSGFAFRLGAQHDPQRATRSDRKAGSARAGGSSPGNSTAGAMRFSPGVVKRP
jgi:hypothetical protein